MLYFVDEQEGTTGKSVALQEQQRGPNDGMDRHRQYEELGTSPIPMHVEDSNQVDTTDEAWEMESPDWLPVNNNNNDANVDSAPPVMAVTEHVEPHVEIHVEQAPPNVDVDVNVDETQSSPVENKEHFDEVKMRQRLVDKM